MIYIEIFFQSASEGYILVNVPKICLLTNITWRPIMYKKPC